MDPSYPWPARGQAKARVAVCRSAGLGWSTSASDRVARSSCARRALPTFPGCVWRASLRGRGKFGSESAKVAQERTRPGGDANTHDLARWPGRLDEIRRFGTVEAASHVRRVGEPAHDHDDPEEPRPRRGIAPDRRHHELPYSNGIRGDGRARCDPCHPCPCAEDLSYRLATERMARQAAHPLRRIAFRRESKEGPPHRLAGIPVSTERLQRRGEGCRDLSTPPEVLAAPGGGLRLQELVRVQRPGQHHRHDAHGEALRLGPLGRLSSGASDDRTARSSERMQEGPHVIA
jgi:hypothetical protein